MRAKGDNARFLEIERRDYLIQSENTAAGRREPGGTDSTILFEGAVITHKRKLR